MNLDHKTLLRYAEYRQKKIAHDLAAQVADSSSLSSGVNIARAQERKFAADFRMELLELASWLAADGPEFVPPLTETEIKEWRFARDHGAEIPEHILEQL